MYILKKTYNLEGHNITYSIFPLFTFSLNFYQQQKKYLHIFENPLMETYTIMRKIRTKSSTSNSSRTKSVTTSTTNSSRKKKKNNSYCGTTTPQ